MAGRRVDGGEIVDVERALSAKLRRERLANIEMDEVDARNRETRRYDVDAIELVVELPRGQAFQQMAADEARPTKDDRFLPAMGSIHLRFSMPADRPMAGEVASLTREAATPVAVWRRRLANINKAENATSHVTLA